MRGFSIVELMIAVVILGILMGIGIPSFQSTVKNNRMTSELNAFITALNQARSEAVKQNLEVALCPSTNGTSCAGSTSWETGWVVYVDRDNDGVIDGGNACGAAATDDCMLSVQSGLSGDITLRSGSSSVSYFGTGASNGAETFTICDSRGADHAKAVIISSTGRPRTSTTQADGSALTCPS